MRILHLGVFDRNIGDSIALDNLQRSFKKYVGDVEFVNYNIEYFWNIKNNIQQTKNFFLDVNSKVNAIVVGGGGLLEYAGYKNNETYYKLPFNKEILDIIKVPIYFYGVGVNIFRGGIDYSSEAKKSLQETINGSTAFTVRNDGSLDKLKNWIKIDTSKVEVVPDPGLLHLERFNIKNKDTVTIGAIQPAFNHSSGINKHRFIKEENIIFLKEFFKSYTYYPHTVRDFYRLGNAGIVTEQEFISYYKLTANLDEYLSKYKEIDYVVAMRGHGQMITIGMNIPGIYFSTQDKVRDFSIENGFENYNVDILDKNWEEDLKEKVELLTKPNSNYLKEWYNIRNTFINKCTETDKNFFKKYFNEMQSM